MRSCLETVLEAVSDKRAGKYKAAKTIQKNPNYDIQLYDVLKTLEGDGFKIRNIKRFEHPKYREVIQHTFSDGTTGLRLFIGVQGYSLTFDSAGILYLIAIGKCTAHRNRQGDTIGITNVYYDEYSDTTLMDGVDKLNADLENL